MPAEFCETWSGSQNNMFSMDANTFHKVDVRSDLQKQIGICNMWPNLLAKNSIFDIAFSESLMGNIFTNGTARFLERRDSSADSTTTRKLRIGTDIPVEKIN